MTRHRVYVVPLRADVPVPWAEAHWHRAHADLFARTPGLLGYVQDRPHPMEDHRVVCSQTWFADRLAERRAYTGEHYLGPVASDEARFVERDAAWTAVVRSAGAPPRTAPPWRALVLGWAGDRPPSGSTVLELDRPGPAGGPPRLLVCPAQDRAGLEEGLAEPGDLHLVSRPAVVVGPAVSGTRPPPPRAG